MRFLRRLEAWLLGYLGKNVGAMTLVVSLFGLGILLGALAVRALDPEQTSSLSAYLHGFLVAARDRSLAGKRVAWTAVQGNARTLGILWALGITVIGLPAVLFIMLVQGFITGFAVAFLVQDLGGSRGVLAALAAVILPGILKLPALLVAGVAAVSFSGQVLRHLLVGRRGGLAGELGRYTFLVVLMAVPLAGAGILAGYASPYVLHMAGGYLAR